MGGTFWYIQTATILEYSLPIFIQFKGNENVSSDSKFILAVVIAIIFIAIHFSMLFANSKVHFIHFSNPFLLQFINVLKIHSSKNMIQKINFVGS